MFRAQVFRKNIGDNVEYIYKLVGLTKKQLYEVLSISEPTLSKVISGDEKYYIDYLINIGSVFGMRLNEISDQRILLPSNYREILINFHKSIQSDIYLTLTQKPSISYAIERILNTDLLNNYCKINQIKKGIDDLIEHTYSTSSLSTEINNFKNLLDFKSDPDNKNHLLYRKKNLPKKSQTNFYLPIYIRLNDAINKSVSFSDLYWSYLILALVYKNTDPVKTKVLKKNFIGPKFSAKYLNNIVLLLQKSKLIKLSTDGNIQSISLTFEGVNLLRYSV